MKVLHKLGLSISLASLLLMGAGCGTSVYLGGNITSGKTTIGVGKSTSSSGVSIYIGHRMGNLVEDYTTGNPFVDEAIENKQVKVIKATKVLPKEIGEAIYDHYNLEPEEIVKTRFYGYSVDLDNDGHDEEIVVMNGPIFSGTGGDSMVILKEGKAENSYEIMQEFTLVRLPIAIADLEKGQKFSDIIMTTGGGGAKSKTIRLKYIDGRYQTVNEAKELKDIKELKDKEALLLVN